jgi:hypothetical protein
MDSVNLDNVNPHFVNPAEFGLHEAIPHPETLRYTSEK